MTIIPQLQNRVRTTFLKLMTIIVNILTVFYILGIQFTATLTIIEDFKPEYNDQNSAEFKNFSKRITDPVCKRCEFKSSLGDNVHVTISLTRPRKRSFMGTMLLYGDNAPLWGQCSLRGTVEQFLVLTSQMNLPHKDSGFDYVKRLYIKVYLPS